MAWEQPDRPWRAPRIGGYQPQMRNTRSITEQAAVTDSSRGAGQTTDVKLVPPPGPGAASTSSQDLAAQHDLAVRHSLLGDRDAAAGNLDSARIHYQTSLNIRERLVALDPANTGWQRDLSTSHNNLGDVDRAAGQFDAARDHYQAGLEIVEGLVAVDPANTQWQRDLSISHNNLGDVDQAAGRVDAARTHYQTGLTIHERLVELDPANTQ